MTYYLGIDAGATKTFCLAGDDTGRILGFGRGGTGNYEAYGVQAARVEIERAVQGALSEARLTLGEIAGIGMGIAGADLPEDYLMLEQELFTPLLGAIPRIFRNDSMGGLRGGIRMPYGIVIACGTGCVCAGINAHGRETRVGGISGDYGDQVSGSSLGEEGLKVVWRAREGIVPPTLMTDKFVVKSGCTDVDHLFHEMYHQRITYKDLQPMAKLVFEAALEGDRAACDLLEWGGRYLGDMVNTAARQLEMTREPFQVVMTGSVFKGSSPVLVDALRTVIHRECPFAEPVMAEFEPVVGTLLLGIEIDKKADDPLYTTLSNSLREAASTYGVQFTAEN